MHSMSAYTYNNHQIAPPPGSVMSFVGGGTTTSGTNSGDPDGWVICDGQTRIVTDYRFVNLFTLLNTYSGGTSNTANRITPPDLLGKFVQGPASAATATQGTGGATSVTLTAAQIPPLSSTTGSTGGIKITDPGHNHGFHVGPGANHPGQPYAAYNQAGYTGGGYGPQPAATGITAAYLNTSQTSVPTVPPYTTMNYIMKY